MSNNVGLDDWKAAIARSKVKNKMIAERAAKAEAENASVEVKVEQAPVVNEPQVEKSIEVEPAVEETTVAAPAVEEPVTGEVSDTLAINDTVSTIEYPTSEEPATEEVSVAPEVSDVVETVETPTQKEADESLNSIVEVESSSTDNERLIKGLESAARSATKQSKNNFNLVFNRVDRPNKKYKGIFNAGLLSFCNEAVTSGKIPDRITLKCTSVYNSNYLGIWEEGGAYNGRGNVLLVTDMYGKPKEAVIAYHNPNTYNGKHSLIRVDMNDHIVLGVQENNKKFIGIYHVTTGSAITKDGGNIVCDRVATVTNRDDEHDDITLVKNLTDYEQTWLCEDNADAESCSTVLDNVLDVATETLFENDVTHPLYIKPYAAYHLNKNDYDNALIDEDYINTVVTYGTIEEAYNALDETFTDVFANVSLSGKDPVVVVTMSLIKTKSGKDMLIAYISGLIYDKATHTSAGSRVFYGRVRITPESMFYYPDSPENRVSYETVVTNIKKYLARPDGSYNISITALKRMK